MVSLEDKKETKSLGNAEEFEPVGDELNQYFEELDVGSDLSDIEEFDDVLEKGPIEFIRSSNSSDDYKNSHNNDHHNTVESKQTSANIKAATATELDTNKSKKTSRPKEYSLFSLFLMLFRYTVSNSEINLK